MGTLLPKTIQEFGVKKPEFLERLDAAAANAAADHKRFCFLLQCLQISIIHSKIPSLTL